MTDQEKEIWEGQIDQKIQIIKEAGAAHKYDCAGIYCIKVAGRILYIGKSLNMLRRIAQHMVDIETNTKTNKYFVLRTLQQWGYNITFDVLFFSSSGTENIEDIIGQKEGEYIREYLPILNYQIPKEENYHNYVTVKRAKTITASEVCAALGI